MNKFHKSLLAALALSFAGFNASAQHLQGVGIHFGGTDFYGPQTGNYFSNPLYRISYNPETGKDDTNKRNVFHWNPTVRVSYWYQLNRWIDLNAGLNVSNLDLPMAKKDSAFINRKMFDSSTRNNYFFGSLDLRVNFNLLPRDRSAVSPYLFAGVSVTQYRKDFGALLPVGVGLNVRLAKSLSLNLESAYKIPLGDQNQTHLQHMAGIVYWFKPGYKAPVMIPTPPFVDTDRDGIVDSLDECPTIAGLPDFNGCPDTDGDGIPDQKDECPLVPGLAQFKGCPDSDGDGIPDQKDKCPYVAGLPLYNGCPPPDRDGDGFPDDVDRCPDQYSKTNGGCPEVAVEVIDRVSKAAKAIFFEPNKATLKKVSYKPLNDVVEVLKADPSLYADIEGHTDNSGNDDINIPLSRERAEAVRNYFVSQGVDAGRLTAEGFGSTQPIATNETAVGKAANRRTVIKLRNFAK